MVSAGALGVLIVVAIIASGSSAYYVAASPLQSQVTSYQSTVSDLQSIISSIHANPSTTTIFSTVTQTSISTSTITAYPLPDNVTFFLVYESGCGNLGVYQIYVNEHTFSDGSIQSGTNSSIPISSLYYGNNVTITFGIGSYYWACASTEIGYLYNNGTQVAYAVDTSNYNQPTSVLITWLA